MKAVRALLVLAVLGTISAITLWESEARLSPGPLHRAHQRISALAGSSGCSLCHGDSNREDSMARACGRCHEAVLGQLAAGEGLHGSLPPDFGSACGTCHREHHGDALDLIDRTSWLRADVEDPRAYAHEHVTDFALHGVHAELGCAACHPHANAALPPADRPRFLGAETDCRACHEDVHESAFGEDCARCHGQARPFPDAPGFAHDTFALRGAHLEIPCASCHEAAAATSITRLLDPPTKDQRTARACADCHADPHGPEGDALRFVGDATDCARCHDATRFEATRFGVAEHAASGIPLRGGHGRADCSDCHHVDLVAGRAQAAVDSPEAMVRCGDCHSDPHAAALREHADRDRGCTPCHTDLDPGFAAGRLEPEQHDLAATGFPLQAPHDGLDCAACHDRIASPQGDSSRRLSGRSPTDCRSCHGDPHGGAFDSGRFAARIAATNSDAVGRRTTGDCLRCHREDAFVPHRFGIEKHTDLTAFPLDGAHRAVDCAACHGVREGPAPRRFSGASASCASCHEDPHGGRFDVRGLPAEVAGRQDCARCHGTTDFRTVPEAGGAFDHALWTSHPLEGKHAAADCADCHGRTASGSLGPAPRRCADCHDDVHAGQFASWAHGRRTAPADCRSCHAEGAEDFRIIDFDHARLTGFVLDESHRDVDCGECHRRTSTRGGDEVVRYRPTPSDCRACHLSRGRR